MHNDLNSCREVCFSSTETAFQFQISVQHWEVRFPDGKKCIWYIGYITDVSFDCFVQYLNKSEILLLR